MSRALKSEIFNACKRWALANCSKKFLILSYTLLQQKKKTRTPIIILHFNLATRRVKANTYLCGVTSRTNSPTKVHDDSSLHRFE